MSIIIEQLGLPLEIEKELRRLSETYDIIKVSDKGQNGYLFIARNRIINRKVAIKFHFWADGARVHVEPASLVAVKSGHIIEVLDASLVGKEWALFVTPFCERGDLDRYRETNHFGLHEALRFVVALLDGVSALHQQAFVHRDLKPENILISDSCLPLIADFGSVRLIPEGARNVPGSGHAVLYRPRESFTSGRYDRRGDIYQCGIVLYQVLGGRLLYSPLAYLSCHEQETLSSILGDYERSKYGDGIIQQLACSGALLDIRSLPEFVPLVVRSIVKKATALDPEERYQSASEFMNALNNAIGRVADWRFVDGEHIAIGPSAKYRLRPGNTHNHFIIQKDRNNGWRKVSGIPEDTKSRQLRRITRIVVK